MFNSRAGYFFGAACFALGVVNVINNHYYRKDKPAVVEYAAQAAAAITQDCSTSHSLGDVTKGLEMAMPGSKLTLALQNLTEDQSCEVRTYFGREASWDLSKVRWKDDTSTYLIAGMFGLLGVGFTWLTYKRNPRNDQDDLESELTKA